MNKIAYICICSAEYLKFYQVLYNSLKKYCPDSKQILYYIGDVQNSFDEIVDINLWYNASNSQYNKLEKICSLRARVVLDAFNKGYDKVVFLGAKMEFFEAPYQLLINLCAYNAVVTPHITEPLPDDGFLPSNASVSFTGHISTDLVGFRKCPEIIKFLKWQDQIMKTQCKTTNNTYLDQSWLNFLPFFVENVKILKDPAYNVAYWNFKQRYLKKSMNWWYVGNGIEKPLVCFQYSGLDLNCPENISTHQNRYKAEGEFLEFLKDYAQKVK